MSIKECTQLYSSRGDNRAQARFQHKRSSLTFFGKQRKLGAKVERNEICCLPRGTQSWPWDPSWEVTWKAGGARHQSPSYDSDQGLDTCRPKGQFCAVRWPVMLFHSLLFGGIYLLICTLRPLDPLNYFLVLSYLCSIGRMFNKLRSFLSWFFLVCFLLESSLLTSIGFQYIH